jgi:hypothetical protein
MDRRYILLSSENRDRNTNPNPFEFQTVSVPYNYTRATKTTASDFVSDLAPIVQWNSLFYFTDVNINVTNYNWSQTADITEPLTGTTTTVFLISFPAFTFAATVPETGWYNGCTVYYGTQYSFVENFISNGDGTYMLVITNPVTIDGSVTLTLQTPYLAANQVYVPNPVISSLVTNIDATLYIHNVQTLETSQITGFSLENRIMTFADNFTFNVDGIESVYISRSEKQITYTVNAVDIANSQITVDIDQPYDPSFLIGQYLYDLYFQPIVSGKITNAVYSSGSILITVDTDVTNVTVADIVIIAIFSNDNVYPFDYFESMKGTQSNSRSETRIGRLELLTLQLPNQLLSTSFGGKPYDYPYLIIDVENQSSSQQTDQVVYANIPAFNKNINKVSFVVTSIPYSAYLVRQVFIQFQPNGMTMPFNIKHSDVLKITVRDQLGQILVLADPDTSPPASPDPLKQITAVFAITFTESNNCFY